jgi:ribosome-associated protein
MIINKKGDFMKEIKINTEIIKLDQLLKFAGITQTGGQSKMIINDGLVTINGEIVKQRGKKIKKGDIIEIKDIDSFIVI